MPVKILTSTLVGMDGFCRDPIVALLQANNGTLAVLHHNAPAFYALTPQRLAQLLALEVAAQKPNDVSLDESLFHSESAPPIKQAGKFSMYHGWQPDDDFQCQAAIWGMALIKPVTSSELSAFIAYWQAEGRLFHHVQWQQKLARSVQMHRGANCGHLKRDITQINNIDYDIPDGFRGE